MGIGCYLSPFVTKEVNELKPNHICGNSECRKEYYACDYCDRTSYRRIACSPECYVKIAMACVAKPPKPVENEKPIEQVYAESVKEISTVVPNVEEIGIDEAVKIINKQIDDEKPKRRRRKKTEVEPSENLLS